MTRTSSSPHAIAATVFAAGLIAILAAAEPAAAGPGPAKGQQLTKATVKGPVGTTRTVTTHCPRGKRVLWGGWRTGNVGRPEQGVLNVFESRRVGHRSWRVSARVALAPEPHRLLVFADCVNGGSYPAASSSRKVGAKGDRTAAASARCPSGMRAVSAGFRVAGKASKKAAVSGFFRTGRGSTWTTELSPARGATSFSGRLQTIAYCGAGGRLDTRAGGFTASNDTYTLASSGGPPCPKAPLSGGFRVVFRDSSLRTDAVYPNALARGYYGSTIGLFFLGPYKAQIREYSYCR